ncbi:beta-galactosidase [Silvimonas amylolytica]|uniref:Beta-galactosidase n=1 Tax=Silvimonas amylolytica TaxID=449663 RepID=A0ABQ2PK02_9NEIS|nr:beta-galactosidase [Silvimonas amylolytica]GGP25319.1 beta-galactosidase [Silvimonas amylolytica]
MKVGVDYYPEHWDRAVWQQDAKDMKAAGIKVVRLAEFAWSRLEPREEVYDFQWLDDAIAVLASEGLEIVLGTPTATPPHWLADGYPDVLPIDSKKQPMYKGVRWHRCYNSPSLRRYTRVIVEKLARHYAGNPAVIGWQTDNEMVANDCHCDACTAGFRQWLERKYSTLDNLNKEWGTVVWSGEYTAWSQVTTPLGGSPHQNPSFLLDFQRFSSDSVADFNKFQADILRTHCPDHFVTHNIWGYPVVTDNYDLFESMDFAAVDYYPATDQNNDAKARNYLGALTLDLTRGIKQKNFWVMEQLSGTPGCWFPMSRTPFPGMIRAHAWQTVSRGADVVVHFRWRTARIGAEQFWHGLLDHHGVPGRRFEEFKRFASELNMLSGLLDGTVVQNQVAMLYSHEQNNALRIQPQVDGFDYLANFKKLHQSFVRQGVGTDVLNWTSKVSDYKLVIAPSLYLEDPLVVQKLADYVEAGGTLVLTTRTGVKNMNNVCLPTRLPGALREIAGVIVDEYDPVGHDAQRIAMFDANTGCMQWCDLLEPSTAKPIAHYDSEYFKGRPAITCNPAGKGRVYYIGTVLDDAGYDALFGHIVRETGIPAFAGLPSGVEVSIRQSGDKRYMFVLNLTKRTHTVHLENHQRWRNAFTGGMASPDILLEQGGVEILMSAGA